MKKITEKRTIKAIETIYNGYKFRSRLEARWAVFFDSLGVQWEYEKEGYRFSDGTQYLPDFWLPGLKYWIEIKGQYPTEVEINKINRLHTGTGRDSFILYGNIPSSREIYEYISDDYFQMREVIEGMLPQYGCIGAMQEYGLMHFVWSCCRYHDDNLALRSDDFGGGWCCKGYGAARVDDPRLIAAYTAARQVRFEHGERPF